MTDPYTEKLVSLVLNGHKDKILDLKENGFNFNSVLGDHKVILEKCFLNNVSPDIVVSLMNAGANINGFEGGKQSGNQVYSLIFKRLKVNIHNCMKDIDVNKDIKRDISNLRTLVEHSLDISLKNCNGDNILHRIARLLNHNKFLTNCSNLKPTNNGLYVLNNMFKLFFLIATKSPESLNKKNNLNMTPLHVFFHKIIDSNCNNELDNKTRVVALEFCKENIKLGFNNFDIMEKILKDRFARRYQSVDLVIEDLLKLYKDAEEDNILYSSIKCGTNKPSLLRL